MVELSPHSWTQLSSVGSTLDVPALFLSPCFPNAQSYALMCRFPQFVSVSPLAFFCFGRISKTQNFFFIFQEVQHIQNTIAPWACGWINCLSWEKEKGDDREWHSAVLLFCAWRDLGWGLHVNVTSQLILSRFPSSCKLYTNSPDFLLCLNPAVAPPLYIGDKISMISVWSPEA